MNRKKALLLVSILLLLGAALGLAGYRYKLYTEKQANRTLQEIARTEAPGSKKKQEPTASAQAEEINGGSGSESAENSANAASTAIDTAEVTEEAEPFVSPINFTELQEVNPDIYAWITIDDTIIDYPVLQSAIDDPDYYIDHTAEGGTGYPGAIFTESDLNLDPFEDKVTLLYGHNMENQTMFGSLKQWADEAYRGEHSVITIYTEKHTYTYRIVFTQTYDDRNILARYDCNNTEKYTEFLQSLETVRSLPYWHSEEVELNTEQYMIVLSTCYGSKRFLVGAVLTEKE